MMTQNLKNDENAMLRLRSLYAGYGYIQYKMSKFEEYDLYVRNKDFLVSENIITFTDTNGKLMALKPDVTLSIIKNTKDENSLNKVYYNENVYRISKGTNSYKEIMQTGLECIGTIDDYSIYEVLMLAGKSLEIISKDFMLDISHLDIISEVIDAIGLSESAKPEVLKCIAEKNIHGIAEICEKENVDCEILKTLVSTYGAPKTVIPKLKEIELLSSSPALSSLITITSLLEDNGFLGKINIDFSVINDMSYYNGFVFKGFINGISQGVLSGGQYDGLMKKMSRKSGAIGFAVYLDLLERLANTKPYDVDTLIIYDENTSLKAINDAVSFLAANGKSVMAQKQIPEKIKYKQLAKLNEKGVEIIENNA